MYLQLFLVAALFTGCAQKEIILRSSVLKPLPVASGDATPRAKYNGQLHVIKFEDQRFDKTSIGIASTGFFNRPTPIQLDISVAEYLQNKFRSELGKHGVEVTSTSKYAFIGFVKHVRVYENNVSPVLERSNCEIEIEFDIVSNPDQTPFYHGTVSVSGNGSNNALDTTSSNGAALETCAQSLAEQFLKNNDLRKKLEIKAL